MAEAFAYLGLAALVEINLQLCNQCCDELNKWKKDRKKDGLLEMQKLYIEITSLTFLLQNIRSLSTDYDLSSLLSGTGGQNEFQTTMQDINEMLLNIMSSLKRQNASLKSRWREPWLQRLDGLLERLQRSGTIIQRLMAVATTTTTQKLRGDVPALSPSTTELREREKVSIDARQGEPPQTIQLLAAIDGMKVTSTSCKVLSIICGKPQGRSSLLKLEDLTELGLESWLSQPSDVSANGSDMVRFNLMCALLPLLPYVYSSDIDRICSTAAKSGFPQLPISFTSSATLKVMKALYLPSCFPKTVCSGTAKIASFPSPGRSKSRKVIDSATLTSKAPQSCIFRSPISSLNRGQKWAAALSWRSDTGTVNVFVTGMEESEQGSLLEALNGITVKAPHPMHVIVILSSIILEEDASRIRQHSDQLAAFELEVRSRVFHDMNVIGDGNNHALPTDIQGGSQIQTKNVEATASLDFDDATKKLSNTWSSLSYHQMRIETIKRFAEHIAENEKAFRIDVDVEPEELLSSLQLLKDETMSLLSEAAYNQRVAQGQVELVYNLVVQKDSRSNLSVAQAAKDDSSAMRNLTLMSIFFLPGTFMSALFSMSMFDWRAGPGESVVSSRFWVYLAFTVPITVVLLFVWWTWMRSELKHDQGSKAKQATLGSLHRASTMKAVTRRREKEPSISGV